MDTTSAIQLAVLLLLLLLSAFFSSAETALTTVNKVRIRSLAEEEYPRALIVQKILDDYSKMLSTILIGNNIVNISASALTTTLAIRIWGNVAVGIATGALTILVLLFGEIIPKTWAMLNAETLSLAYSRTILFLMHVLTPLIFLIDKLSGIILSLLGIDSDSKSAAITERDLRTYVDVSHEDGAIESEEREMIYNVFDFSDSAAKDIMIPKIDITMVNIDATYHDLLNIFKESMYTRIPVYQDDTDNIVGIVNIKDFLFVPNKKNFRIQDIIRDAYYTYEFKKTADLMMEMREATMNVAFVLNEYAACVGMITLEDLLEEIVGEIRDEYDADEEEFIKEVGNRQYLVEGSMKLDDVNDALGTVLYSEDYDSIGGILIEALDRLPEDNEEIILESGITLQAKGIEKNRITKVLMTLPAPEIFIDKTLHDGRPKDTENLLPTEVRCYDFLDKLGISYKRLSHDAMPTIEACQEVDKLLETEICKNLFLSNRQETAFYLVLMPGKKKFLTKELSAQLGVARLSFAKEEYMQELLDIAPGSVSILGLMNDTKKQVRLIIDKEILEQEYFACHPNVNTASLRFKTSDLTEKIIPALSHEPVIVTL